MFLFGKRTTANLYSHLEYNAKIASAETIARVLGGAESKSEVKDTKAADDTLKGQSEATGAVL